MSQCLCVFDFFDLVRWPGGLHGSRLLSAGNLSHYLPVCGLPGSPGHHPGDTDVLCTEQPTDFLWQGALPCGQGQHPHNPWSKPLRWQVSDFCITLTRQHPAQPSLTNSLNNITRTSYGIGLNSLFILHRHLLFMLKILVRFLLVEPVKLSVDAQWTQQLCYRFLK